MDALLFAIALEVALLQMRIVEGSTELRAPHLTCTVMKDKLKLDKLVRDRQTVTDVIRRTLTEVAESGEWRTLQQAIILFDQRSCSALARRSRHERLKNTIHEITNELTTKRNQWTLKLHNADRKVALLRDKMKDDILNANTRLCFAEKWLCAQAESLDLKSARQRKPAPRADHEQRVHEELLKAIDLQTKEREEAMEYWREKYSEDIARMNEELMVKRQELQVVEVRHIELQKLYDLHEGEMRAWLSFKQQRAERLAREERARAAATRIQAWWRGVMVCRALGSFRYLRSAKKSPTKSKKK